MNYNINLFYLCLNCRLKGHIFQDCPEGLNTRYWHSQWCYTKDRKELLESLTPGDSLCGRCEALDILSMFQGQLPWHDTECSIPSSVYSTSPFHRDLGDVSSIIFDSRCPLCVTIFGITPNPNAEDEHVHLLSEWSIHRFEILVDVKSHPDHSYDRCIIADVLSKGESFKLRDHDGDAIGIQRHGSQVLPCSGLRIERLNFNLLAVQSYLSLCQENHKISCVPLKSIDLANITLIDVVARSLVAYPRDQCEYLALSYTWGGIAMPTIGVDFVLPTMPAVVEDAIRVTAMLGKRYLWVDSVCINHSNEEEFQCGLSKMADIYRGAYATIVSMCGTSADHGLTRAIEGNQTQPQLSCVVNGKTLVGLMPSLSRQIANQKWGSRAWTLQEGLLSPRCIYFTDHQVYFECNAMQCCESIDISQSWIHNSIRDVVTISNNPRGQVFGHGTLRNSTTGLGKPQDPMMAYGVLIALYSYRQMSYDRDALNAISAILRHLKDVVFEHGFCWGLPEDDLNWSLLWCPLYRISRRSKFPGWSWAGWKGGIHPGWPSNVNDMITQPYTSHFYAWVFEGSMRRVFPHHDHSEASQSPFPTSRHTVFDPIYAPEIEPGSEEICMTGGTSSGYLLLDCLVMRHQFSIGEPEASFNYGPWQFYRTQLGGVSCHLRLAHSTDHKRVTNINSLASFILTGRDKFMYFGENCVIHHFLDVDIDKDGKATRRSVLQLIVPDTEPQALDGITVTRRNVILV